MKGNKILLLLLFWTTTLTADLEKPREVYVKIEQGELYCHLFGKGKPLLVIHGGPGLSQDYLLPYLQELKDQCLLVFYDQRGAGKSKGEVLESTQTIASFMEDIDAIRKTFGWERVSILGHSWGGLLAMHYAVEHPEAVDRLILSNSLPASFQDVSLFMSEYLKRTAPFQEQMRLIENTESFKQGSSEKYEEFLRIIFKTYCYHPQSSDLLCLQLEPSAVMNSLAIQKIWLENYLLKPFDLYPSLAKSKVPTLIVHGSFDPIPVVTASHLHESIPGSQFVVLENCGHFPYVERPKEYFEALRKFLYQS